MAATTSTALIGSTGFVGGILARQATFVDVYNSTNIDDIRGHSYDLVVSAGAPAVKWLANQSPEQDRASIGRLMRNLEGAFAERFILISTVDVYPNPVGIDEDTPIAAADLQPYGRHRYELEQFVRGKFPRATAVRLPGLFGAGLKKNFVYDLLHKNYLQHTHYQSIFQFYDLDRLWTDLQVLLPLNLDVVNFATEPVSAGDVAREGFGVAFDNVTEAAPVRYDMRTRHSALFGSEGGYIASEAETLERIRRFVETERGRMLQ